SGANFQRPGFQAMLADIEAGKVGTVIVKDMSRLGRNYLQVGFYTEMLFPQKGVRFIAVNDNVDSANGGTGSGGLSMKCYRKGKEFKTCLGERQLRGRIGKLLYARSLMASCFLKSSKE